jgi:hypothetical protein
MNTTPLAACVATPAKSLINVRERIVLAAKPPESHDLDAPPPKAPRALRRAG